MALELDEAGLAEVQVKARVAGGKEVAERGLKAVVVERQRSGHGGRNKSKERKELHG